MVMTWQDVPFHGPVSIVERLVISGGTVHTHQEQMQLELMVLQMVKEGHGMLHPIRPEEAQREVVAYRRAEAEVRCTPPPPQPPQLETPLQCWRQKKCI
jgi:hypothetical protein